MVMFCTNCEKFFTEEQIVWKEIGASLGAPTYFEGKCPYCGAEEITEARECELCGEPIEKGCLCGECRKAIKKELGIFHKRLAVKWQMPEAKVKEAVLDYIAEVE